MKKLSRSTTDKWLAGVFGGAGELFDVDPNILRLSAFFLGIVTGFVPLLATYVVAWLTIPRGSPAGR